MHLYSAAGFGLGFRIHLIWAEGECDSYDRASESLSIIPEGSSLGIMILLQQHSPSVTVITHLLLCRTRLGCRFRVPFPEAHRFQSHLQSRTLTLDHECRTLATPS